MPEGKAKGLFTFEVRKNEKLTSNEIFLLFAAISSKPSS